jgi:thioesterase domain-containing protein
VQPEGPYVVGGLCAGGLISYEIARQLREAGQEIGLVALIEAAPPYAKKRVTRSGRRWQRFSALSAVAGANGVRKAVGEAFGKLGNVTSFELKRTAGRFASATKLFLLRNVYKGGQGWPGNVPPPTVRETYAGAERAFQPRPIDDVTLTVYAATSGTGSNEPFCEILSDPLFDWQGLSRQSVVRVDVPGGHSTMLQEPNVEVLARHMSGFLADANGASPRGSDGEGLAPDDRSGEGLTATQ